MGSDGHKGFYLAISVLSHIFWGAYPAIFRYLQVEGNFAALMLSSCASSAAILLTTPVVLYMKDYLYIWRIKKLWMWSATVLGIYIGFPLSVRYTQSIYFQLILLAVPFVTVFASKLALKQTIPPYTTHVLIVTFAGAFLALSGDLLSSTGTSLTDSDLVGIAFSVLSCLSQGLYFTFIQTISEDVPKRALIWFEALTVVTCVIPLSLLTEDWTILRNMELRYVAVLIFYVLVVWSGAMLFTYTAIPAIGSPMHGAISPIRLVVAVALGLSPWMNETISYVNAIGYVIVFVSVVLYVFKQYKLSTVPRAHDPQVHKDNIDTDQLLVAQHV